jgi:hypothetical protein
LITPALSGRNVRMLSPVRPISSLASVPDRADLVEAVDRLDGDHRWLVDHDPFAGSIDEGVRGPEVYRQLAGI